MFGNENTTGPPAAPRTACDAGKYCVSVDVQSSLVDDGEGGVEQRTGKVKSFERFGLASQPLSLTNKYHVIDPSFSQLSCVIPT